MASKTYEDFFALYFLAPTLLASHACLSQLRAAVHGCCTAALNNKYSCSTAHFLMLQSECWLTSALSSPLTHWLSPQQAETSET